MKFYCVFCETDVPVKTKQDEYNHRARCKSYTNCEHCGERMQGRSLKIHLKKSCRVLFGDLNAKRRRYDLGDKLKYVLLYDKWVADKLPEKQFFRTVDFDRRALKSALSAAKSAWQWHSLNRFKKAVEDLRDKGREPTRRELKAVCPNSGRRKWALKPEIAKELMELVVAARGPRDQTLESIFEELPSLANTESLWVWEDNDDSEELARIEANGERTVLRYRGPHFTAPAPTASGAREAAPPRRVEESNSEGMV